MNRQQPPRRPELDDVLAAIREDGPSPSHAASAAERVRHRLGLESGASPAAGPIDSCEGFQSRIPGFLAGRLSSAEALLVDDHTRACVPCRRALVAARAGRDAAVETRRESGSGAWRLKWAAAATFAAMALLAGFAMRERLIPPPDAQPIAVESVQGDLWRVDRGATALLAAGSVLPENEVLRTAPGSRAIVRLADGSRVELRDRTELTVKRRRDGATIALSGGGIIVEAAKQGSGHLDVRTDDALVSVKGTIFAVNHGVSGSRVAVLEGAVAVNTGGEERMLRPGDRASSRPDARPVPLRDDLAWSADSPKYEALLRELASIRKDLRDEIEVPAPRTASRLLSRIPADTAIFVAVPNLSGAFEQASAVLDRHLDQSPELREWWDSRTGNADARREMDEAVAMLREYGRAIGDEIVIAVPLGNDGKPAEPVVLAEVRDAESLKAMLARDVAKVKDVQVRLEEDRLVAGTARSLAAYLPAGDAAPSAFHRRIADAYADGAAFVFAVDLERVIANAGKGDPDTLATLGFANARDLLVERTEHDGRTTTTAELTFAGERSGIASWLAAPSPLGSLRYVSPDASAVAAFAVTSPGTAVADLVAGFSQEAAEGLARFRRETGLDLVEDVARPLGGEIAVALDGPVLPSPAWKMVLEVYDPARVQRSLETLVERANAKAREQGREEIVRLRHEAVGDRSFHAVEATTEVYAVWYAFDGGYLVAAPSRVLVEQAIDRRASGVHIGASAAFRSLLPADARTEYSGIVYERLGEVLGEAVRNVGAGSSPEARALLGERPHLITIVAESSRIRATVEAEGGLGADLGTLLTVLGAASPEGAVPAIAGPPAP
ncbi:MAG TPA: FecR domain-containing protein [Candidatus Polarisedimenticolaceae bacterium]